MKPVRLLLLLFAINLFAVSTAIMAVRPSIPSDFNLYDVSIQKPAEDNEDVITGKPLRLVVESLGLDVMVVDGSYDIKTHEWELSGDKAHYALITPLANNKVGNTFIYGHNRREVFSKLGHLSRGDEAKLITDNNLVFHYKLSSSREVEPTDISLFEYRGSSILTLQTCSGSWYEKRTLYTFNFDKVERL